MLSVQKVEESQAIHAEYNHHYMNFVIVTKRDVRIINAETGTTDKIFTDVVDKKTDGDITAFALDDRHRKCYIGDTYGCIRVFNVSNGVFIKTVDDPGAHEMKWNSKLWRNSCD